MELLCPACMKPAPTQDYNRMMQCECGEKFAYFSNDDGSVNTFRHQPAFKETILLGMPCGSNNINIGAARCFYAGSVRKDSGLRVITAWSQGGITHNNLWCVAMNGRIHDKLQTPARMAMIHSDVEADEFWLQTMIEIQDKTGCDWLSAVIPLKTAEGVTSTGIMNAADPMNDHCLTVRRLTMHEIMKLPKTFSAEDVSPGKGFSLALNTGLWVMKLDAPWIYAEAPRIPGLPLRMKMHWSGRGWIERNEKGDFIPGFDSEDWLVSLYVARAGGKMLATREVGVNHWGETAYGNDQAWGLWQTDESYLKRMKEMTVAA